MLFCLKILGNCSACLLICLIIYIVTINAQQTDEVSNVEDYLKKVCDGVPTCGLINTVPENYRNLDVRNCMCDEECADYGDCCEDSFYKSLFQYENTSSIECVDTVIDGSVYMITDCPAERNSSDVIVQNCLNRDTNILNIDVLSSTPVTSTITYKTYKNVFCALCNDDSNITFWDILVTYDDLLKVIKYDTNRQSMTKTVDADSILNTITINDNYYWQFRNANAGLVVTKCYLNSTVPETLLNRVRPCLPNVIKACGPNWTDETVSEKCHQDDLAYTYIGNKVYKNKFCAQCNNEEPTKGRSCLKEKVEHKNRTFYEAFRADIGDERIWKLPFRCANIPSSLPAREELCQPRLVAPPAARIRTSCFPLRKELNPPKPCLLNAILNRNDTQLIFEDNNTIIYLNTKYVLNEEFFYSGDGDESVMICGTYVNPSQYSYIFSVADDVLTKVLIKISIVCLILQLLMFQQLPELRNLSGKNLACFSFTLMIAFICYDLGPYLREWTGSCRITAIILHYTLLSCFTWMLIMSYDCWLSLYRATVQFRTSAGKGHNVKFTIYLVVCATLPLIFVGYTVYLEFLPVDQTICRLHPGYDLAENCFIFNLAALYYFFFLPASVSFFGNICFFAHTAYMIYLSQRKSVNPNTRNDFKLYTRLALMMGLTWTLGSVRYMTGSELIGLMFTTMNMSQGIFIFFGFTFKKKFIKLLLAKHKNNRFLTKILSPFASSSTNTKVLSENRTETDAV